MTSHLHFKQCQVNRGSIDHVQSQYGRIILVCWMPTLQSLFCIFAVRLDQLLTTASKGVTPQEECAQSLILTPGSRSTITMAETVLSRLRMQLTYDGRYAYTKRQQDVPTPSWPKNATKDSVAEAACHYLQTTYKPEDVMVIAVQSAIWMGHDWTEASVKI